MTLVNEDEVNHTFTLEGPTFEVEAAGGEEASGTLDVPDGDATYAFFCRFHPDSMRGKMIIGEGGAETGSGGGAPEDDGAYDY